MRKFAFIAAATAVLSIAAPAGASTTIFDEDFENGLGAFTATGQVGINTGSAYVGCCGVFGSSASLANHFVAFGSGDLPSGTLESTPFNLIAGETYTLSFDLFGIGSNFEDFTVEFGRTSSVISKFTIADLFNLDLAPQSNRTLQFTPGSSTTATLKFHSEGLNSVDSIIDNVLLVGPAGAVSGVPEPATWVMMLLGFGGIGLSMQRRRMIALA